MGGILNRRLGEDAVGQIHPAVRSPGESVEQFMPILKTESRQQRGLLVRFIVAVGILKEVEVRCLPDINASVAQQKCGRKIESIREHRHLVGSSVVIGILEDLDAIPSLLPCLHPHRILVKLEHPKTTAVVPGHGHGIHHHRLAGEEPDLKPVWHGELFLCRLGRECRRARRQMLSGKLLARDLIRVDWKIVNGFGYLGPLC